MRGLDVISYLLLYYYEQWKKKSGYTRIIYVYAFTIPKIVPLDAFIFNIR